MALGIERFRIQASVESQEIAAPVGRDDQKRRDSDPAAAELDDRLKCGIGRSCLMAVRQSVQDAVRRRFELLKRAYVEARYSDQYDASAEDLEWLTARARLLRDLVADLCQSRIAELKSKAANV